MKISICLLIVAFAGVLVNGFTVPNTPAYTKQSNAFIAKTLSEVFINRLKQDIRSRPLSPGAKVTLLPSPIDDPACLGPIDLPDIDIKLPGLLNVTGNFALTEAAEVTGLSKLVDDFNLILVTQTITYNVDIPSVKIAGVYDMALNLDMGPDNIHDIKGMGDFAGSVNNVFLKINAKLKIPIGNNPIGLASLTVDLGIKDLTLDGEGSTIDEEPIDWVSVATDIQKFVDDLVASDDFKTIIEMIRCAVDDFINECTVADLVAGELECLKEQIKWECFGAPESFWNVDFKPNFSINACTALTGETVSPTSEVTGDSESTAPSVSTTPNGALSTSSSSFIALLSVLIAKYVL